MFKIEQGKDIFGNKFGLKGSCEHAPAFHVDPNRTAFADM
jgi:hypothetical protein